MAKRSPKKQIVGAAKKRSAKKGKKASKATAKGKSTKKKRKGAALAKKRKSVRKSIRKIAQEKEPVEVTNDGDVTLPVGEADMGFDDPVAEDAHEPLAEETGDENLEEHVDDDEGYF